MLLARMTETETCATFHWFYLGFNGITHLCAGALLLQEKVVRSESKNKVS